MRLDNRVGIIPRGVALHIVGVFLGGTLVGSLAPESGNALALWLGYSHDQTHIFNPYFLVVGVIGIVLACLVGYRCSR